MGLHHSSAMSKFRSQSLNDNSELIKTYAFYQQLCKLTFIDKIILFGSRARGDHKKKSDIDLGILCPHANHADWISVTNIITDADTLLPIDCIRCDTLPSNSLLLHNIYNEGVCLYEKTFT